MNTYHRTIKIKNLDVKSSTCIDSSKEINDEDPKFKISDTVRISKHKNFVLNCYCYVPIWSEEVFGIKKAKNTLSSTYVLRDLKGE